MNKCFDTECRYQYCKRHPKGCVITNDEERMLSSSICRKQISRLVYEKFEEMGKNNG